MSEYSEFFLNCDAKVVELELVEISHSHFTQVFRIVRNAVNGITVTLENSTSQLFEYYPLQITPVGAGDDLDQILKVQLGDLGDLLPQQLDAVFNADGFNERPVLIYRTYRSDDLTKPLYGPLYFQIDSLTFNKEGAAFEAKAPRLNSAATGELYTLERFEMLGGFL